MPPRTTYPEPLGFRPFRGADAVARGLVTRAQLKGRGWRRLLPDVHIRADAVVDHLTWCEAVLLTAPGGSVLGYRSALGLYCPGLVPAADAPVDLVVRRPARPREHDRLRIHRTRLEACDVGTRRGFPVTTPARTGFDLARGEDLVEAVVSVDALLDRRVTTVAEIAAYLPRRLAGAARARRALALASPGAQSPMETRTRLLLVLAGLPEPQVQYEVLDEAGAFVARLDLAYPWRRIGVEYDGDHHREREVFQRDTDRANRLRLCDWTVLRFTAEDVLRHPDRAVWQVRRLLARSAGHCGRR